LQFFAKIEYLFQKKSIQVTGLPSGDPEDREVAQ
jgi:hypothetical protein